MKKHNPDTVWLESILEHIQAFLKNQVREILTGGVGQRLKEGLSLS